jgi:hypothetical protein
MLRHCPWAARDVPSKYTLALWNPVMLGDFLKNYEGSVEI